MEAWLLHSNIFLAGGKNCEPHNPMCANRSHAPPRHSAKEMAERNAVLSEYVILTSSERDMS